MARRTARLAVWPILAILAVAFLGCSGETWNWEAFGKSEPTRAQKPAPPRERQPQIVAARPQSEPEPEDPQVREMNEKIDQYVDNMSRSSRNDYAPNDINSKIARQQDPDRRRRISRAAEQTKVQPAGADTEQPVRTTIDKDPTPSRGSHDRPPPPAVAETAATRQPAPTDCATSDPEAAVRPESDPSNPRLPASSTTTEADGPLVDDRTPPTPAAQAKNPAPAASDQPTDSIPKERPPVLEDINIAPAEKPATPPDTAEQTRPTANPATPLQEPADTFQQRLEELEAKVRAEPNNYGDQFKLRMMYLLAGRQDKVTAPISGTDAELQEIIVAHFRTLLAAQSGSGRDAAVAANLQLGELEHLRGLVRAKADLQVPKVVVCSAIEGFGRYTPIEPAEFQAGQKNRILLYIEVDNFISEKTGSGMFRTLLTVQQSLLSKAGEEMWNTQDSNIEDLARQQRRDFYLTVGPLSIPPTLSPGEYVLKVEVEDVLAGKLNSNVARFRLLP